MRKLKGAFEVPILIAAAFAAVLIALGVGYKAGNTNIEYEGNLWCVSNYIQKEPTEYTKDGRPVKHPLLNDRGDWIRKDQIEVDPSTDNPQEQAMSLATKDKLFERATKEEMIAALEKGDKEFFTHHFNATATSAGPCWGTGSTEDEGLWINDAIKSECFDTGEYEVVKTVQANITTYSPCVGSNRCDCPVSMGGDSTTADGTGKFKIVDGRLRWVKNDGSKTEDYVLAQPTSDHLIKWSEREKYAVVIPGFSKTPIFVRDHYAPGLHSGQNYFDIFMPCDEWKNSPAGKKTVQIVDVTKKKSSDQPKDERCPKEAPQTGPSYGQDLTDKVPTYFPKEESGGGTSDYTGEITATTYESADLGRSASPGGNSYTPQFGGRKPLHGKTQCKSDDDEGHGVYKNREDVANGRGDAIDITPSGGRAIAAFDGTAYPNYGSRDESSGSERSGGVRLVSKDKRVVAYYYHTFPMVRPGQEVSAGTAIARTGADGIGHIHFELLVDGKSVHGNSSLCGQPEQYVRSLWANMKKVLGIGV